MKHLKLKTRKVKGHQLTIGDKIKLPNGDEAIVIDREYKNGRDWIKVSIPSYINNDEDYDLIIGGKKKR